MRIKRFERTEKRIETTMAEKGKYRKRGCADNAMLVAAFTGDLGSGEAAWIREHTENCPRCRAKLEILIQIRPELEARRDLVPEKLTRKERRAWRLLTAERIGIAQPEQPAPPFAPSASRRLRPAWIAAVALLFVAAGYLAFSRIARTDIMRGDASSGLKIVTPIGLLSEAPRILVWQGFPGADYYEITIASEAYETVFSGSSLSPAPFLLGEEVLKALKPGVVYLWTVVAKDDLSRRVASGRASFEIR